MLPARARFDEKLRTHRQYPLLAESVSTLQINVGRRCNLHCRHCHLGAGPGRSELMSLQVLQRCLELLGAHRGIQAVDVTGGAPELNPHLEPFLRGVAALGKRMMVRSNLAILTEPAYQHFASVFAELGVELVGSLPDLRAERTDRQRGPGSFAKIVEAMRALNRLGYSDQASGLRLSLVHNPMGTYLPGSQRSLEQDYRRELASRHRVSFDALLTLANMPIGRYGELLSARDGRDAYLELLERSFNPAAVPRVMCRTLVSVRWDGALFDCDFNQALGLSMSDPELGHLDRFDLERLSRREIAVAAHCFGCTAGSGSSCQGCLT